jgi:hypothetical protein
MKIQISSNEQPSHFQMGDNHKHAKIGWELVIILKKKIYLRTTGPEKLRFT